ncbi:3-methyl-2-oxobutanoate hydroxymethyltransferase [Campylobacter iguaniorum]|uniref:3-methyl-2-oxobutanoate hydroxymethyltransferase n=1 Tax=Campylobacter iguaniorum TaxID=1244531 RepID=UPI00073A5F7E|nr:3-methyl-2-oxobutanoate hydroxymethyltransferase [Campylobacter iguaniorum]ALV24163.1 3-methyl-2-oxobutanoate hydroxymethyltransferase [Campylobacter iguaniorum]
MKKITIGNLQAMKGKEKIAMITAYDALFAKIFDDEVDMILVGDSLNMSFNGKSETIGIGLEEMIYHAKAVKVGCKRAYLVVDMPFGSTVTPQITLESAVKIYKETGCDAVKIEGGANMAETIKLLSQNGIAVMAHIGLKPQTSRALGGYKISGRDENSVNELINDALILQEAGAVLFLIEGTVSEAAAEVTKRLGVPTIGIGSGVSCDGQVLVWSDAFGFFDEFQPKFVKRFLNGAELIKGALKEYVNEVKTSQFPSSAYEYQK